jgi:hypothetical protein
VNKNILSIPRGLRLAMCGVWDKARGQKAPVEIPEQQSVEPLQTTETPDGAAPECCEAAPECCEATPAIVDYRDLDFDVEFDLNLDHDGGHVPVLVHNPVDEALDDAVDVEAKRAAEPQTMTIVREPQVADDPRPHSPKAKPTPAKRVPAQAGEPSPTARRREIAEELLATVGRTRPIVARDVAERFGSGVDRSQRESARTALNRMVACGLAVRLPDGSFIPADGTGESAER